jgi:hypothetical protein
MSRLSAAISLLEEIKKKQVRSLSDWEESFIKSIEQQIACRRSVSFKQGQILQNIFRKCYKGFSLRFR